MTSSRPLTETLLIALYEGDTTNIPSAALTRLFPEHEHWENLDDLATFAHTREPLHHWQNDETGELLSAGSNTFGINFGSKDYKGWITFRSRVSTLLSQIDALYSQSNHYESLRFIYFDRFEGTRQTIANKLNVFATHSSPHGTSMSAGTIRFDQTYHSHHGEHVLTVLYEYEGASNADEWEVLMTTQVAHERVPRPLSEEHKIRFESWMDRAHLIAKRAYFDAITRPEREAHRGNFSNDEWARFTTLSAGVIDEE